MFLIPILTPVVVAIVAGTSKSLYTKKKYKNKKKIIYSILKKSLDEKNIDEILGAFELLKNFDEKRKDELGHTKKKVIELLFRRDRKLKCDKTQELFGIKKEFLEDKGKLEQYFKDIEIIDVMKAEARITQTEIEVLEEKTRTEDESLILLDKHLNSIKLRHIAINKDLRLAVDRFNLTATIEDIHKEYKGVLYSIMESDEKLKRQLAISQKKDRLTRKLEKQYRLRKGVGMNM